MIFFINRLISSTAKIKVPKLNLDTIDFENQSTRSNESIDNISYKRHSSKHNSHRSQIDSKKTNKLKIILPTKKKKTINTRKEIAQIFTKYLKGKNTSISILKLKTEISLSNITFTNQQTFLENLKNIDDSITLSRLDKTYILGLPEKPMFGSDEIIDQFVDQITHIYKMIIENNAINKNSTHLKINILFKLQEKDFLKVDVKNDYDKLSKQQLKLGIKKCKNIADMIVNFQLKSLVEKLFLDKFNNKFTNDMKSDNFFQMAPIFEKEQLKGFQMNLSLVMISKNKLKSLCLDELDNSTIPEPLKTSRNNPKPKHNYKNFVKKHKRTATKDRLEIIEEEITVQHDSSKNNQNKHFVFPDCDNNPDDAMSQKTLVEHSEVLSNNEEKNIVNSYNDHISKAKTIKNHHNNKDNEKKPVTCSSGRICLNIDDSKPINLNETNENPLLKIDNRYKILCIGVNAFLSLCMFIGIKNYNKKIKYYQEQNNKLDKYKFDI